LEGAVRFRQGEKAASRPKYSPEQRDKRLKIFTQ
jgi:hypothetical protein